MRQITYDEAYYLYALAYLGLMDEFKFEVMQKVNSSSEADAIYGELRKSFDDTSELLNMLAPKFAGHVNYAGAKAENLFEANKKLIGYLYELYDSDKLSAEEIAEGLSKIAPVSECYVFVMIGKCYSDVKAGKCDKRDFDRAMRSFLSKGEFNCRPWNVSLYKDRTDPDTGLKLGSAAHPSMGLLDRIMRAYWPHEIELVHCGGPVQMCVFWMEYRYLPSDYMICIECERSIVTVTVTNSEGKRFIPTSFYPEANYYHSVSKDNDLKQLIFLTHKAITSGETDFR